MNKIYSLTSKNQMTLPKEIRETLGLASSRHVQFVKEGSRVYIERAASISDVQISNKKILRKNKLTPATNKEISGARNKFYSENESW